MLARITALLFFILLVWGNLVAGMKAGLACPDWPLCLGTFFPPLRLDVWMEFLHRLLAALATLFLVMLAGQRWKSYRGIHKALPLVVLALLILQIAIGGVVVLLGLPIQLTTVHFMLGVAIFVLVLYLAICDGVTQPPLFSLSGYAGLLFGILFLIISQASLGAYLRHSGSALACTGFLACQGSWIPEVWDLPIAVNYAHRLMALTLLSTTAVLFGSACLDQSLKIRPLQAFALLLLVSLQIGVGAAVVQTGLSFPLSGLHLALALVTLHISLKLWLEQIRLPGTLLK